MPLCPLRIGQCPWSAGQLHVCLLEADADVQLWVLRLDGEHLAAVLGGKETFGFHDHPVRQAEVRGVRGVDGVGQGPPLVIKGKAPFV